MSASIADRRFTARRAPDAPAAREAQLLVCCVRVAPERAARLRSLVAEGIDWQRAIHMASRQVVLPLVYRCLDAEFAQALPAQAAESLRRTYAGNSVRNLHLARELIRLSAVLERSGIEAIAIKGPALAVAAYGSVTMRQFSDLDLLVRKEEVAPAVALLQGEGYALCPGYSLADLERRGGFEIAMGRDDALTEVDLHWRLAPPYFPITLEDEGLWRRAVRVEIEGAAVRTLAAADHLLFLCAHGAKHGWQALGSVCDVAALIRASAPGPCADASPMKPAACAIDWEDLADRAERAGAVRALLLGVLLAHEVLDAAVPAALLERARRAPAIVRAARSFIAYVNDPGDGGPGLFQRWLVPLAVIESPAARVRYFAARALLPSADDRRLLRLPAALRPLYFLLRPLRVMLKEGPAMMRRRAASARGDR